MAVKVTPGAVLPEGGPLMDFKAGDVVRVVPGTPSDRGLAGLVVSFARQGKTVRNVVWFGARLGPAAVIEPSHEVGFWARMSSPRYILADDVITLENDA